MADTATARRHMQAAREDMEMTVLAERLELLTSQRCLAAMRCQQFADMMENAIAEQQSAKAESSSCESRAAGGEDCQGGAHTPSPRAPPTAATSRRASFSRSSSRRASFELPANRETAQYYGASSKPSNGPFPKPSEAMAGGAAGSRGVHHHHTRAGRRGSLDISRGGLVPPVHQGYPKNASESGAHRQAPQATSLFQFKGLGKASIAPQAARAPAPKEEQLFEYAALRTTTTALPAQAQPAVYHQVAAPAVQARAYQGSESDGDTSAPSDDEDFLRSSQRPRAHRRASLDLPARGQLNSLRPAFSQAALVQQPAVHRQQASLVDPVHHQQQLKAGKGRMGHVADGSATEDADTSEASDAGEFLSMASARAGRRHSLDLSLHRGQVPVQACRAGAVPNRPCPVMAAALAAVSPEDSSSGADSDSDSDSGPKWAFPVSLARRASLEVHQAVAGRLVADDFLTSWETPRSQWRRSSRQIVGHQ